jgi:hypothetical protein
VVAPDQEADDAMATETGDGLVAEDVLALWTVMSSEMMPKPGRIMM